MAESGPGLNRWVNETLSAMMDGQPKRVSLVTGRVFYLLICRECGDGDLVMPFDSPAERGKWAAAHTAGTGHQRWFVTESTTRLSREQVTGMLDRHDGTPREDPGTTELRLLAADLLELHEANALTGIRAVVAERLRRVRGEPAEGIDGRAYEAALLAEEIDQEAAR